jgi:hypothetical protein
VIGRILARVDRVAQPAVNRIVWFLMRLCDRPRSWVRRSFFYRGIIAGIIVISAAAMADGHKVECLFNLAFVPLLEIAGRLDERKDRAAEKRGLGRTPDSWRFYGAILSMLGVPIMTRGGSDGLLGAAHVSYCLLISVAEYSKATPPVPPAQTVLVPATQGAAP